MRNSLVIFIFTLFTGIFCGAQLTMHKLLTAGYEYQNQSFAEVGGKLLFLKTDDVLYRIGASALLGSANAKFAAMPKIQGDVLINFERNVDFYHAYYFIAGAEATTKYVAPKIGATLAGILDITGGYGFSIDKKGINGKQLKGLNIAVTLNLPIPLIHDLTH